MTEIERRGIEVKSLVISREDAPGIIDWRAERAAGPR